MNTRETQFTERLRTPSVEWIYVTVVLLALVIPGVFTYVSTASTEAALKRERRVAASAPKLKLDQLATFPAAYRDWYAHNFGFRTPLLQVHARLWFHLFGITPGDQMALGADGWLFTRLSRSLDAERGSFPFEESELEAWRITLESRRDWLAARDIEFLFVIVPDKPAVYPERMPHEYEFVGPSRRDQFLAYMREHSDVRILDLTAAVREAKQFDQPNDHVYYPLGTHWTTRGAFFGYRAILAELSRFLPGMDAWSLTDFRSVEDRSDDDVAPQLFLEDVLQQNERDLEPKRQRHGVKSQLGKRSRPDELEVWTNPDADLPRLLLIHDSSSGPLKPMFAEHFSRMQTDQTDSFSVWTIEENKPDVVMQIYVDRFMQRVQPTAQTVFDQDRIRELFHASTEVRLPASAEGRYPELVPFKASAIDGGGDRPAELHLSALNQGFLIDEFPAGRPSEMSVLRMVVDSPADSVASVFYMEAQAQGYRHQRCETIPVHAGANEIYIVLSSPTLQGALLVRPGYAAGDYTIRDLEVRSIPR